MHSNYEIRADFNDKTIVVYQAYNKLIATSALENQKFVTPFSFNRMTWIKPSFLWLMERSNWGQKSNQEYILGIRIKREGWEKALSEGVLTTPEERVYADGEEWREKFENAKVHIQWDPERNIRGTKLDYQSIQVGISRFLINDFVEDWITEIKDYTPLATKIHHLCKQGKYENAKKLLPKEYKYAITDDIKKIIGAD